MAITDELFTCPYCGYTSTVEEYFESGDFLTPVCPDCGEDLEGDLDIRNFEEEI